MFVCVYIYIYICKAPQTRIGVRGGGVGGGGVGAAVWVRNLRIPYVLFIFGSGTYVFLAFY